MLAVLDYADGVTYNLTHNDLWTAGFRLPSTDAKNALCQMHNLVSIEDGARDIGKYRIIGVPNDLITDRGGYVEYSCEHVIATLLDDILFGYHEIGGGTVRTADVIRYILARQEVERWRLGVCEFENRFAYKFENNTLLTALLSLGEVIDEPYTWDFDTNTTPWTINLRKADSAPGCGIYYKRNLQQILRTVDASTLVTRLYLLGYGEGVNQLTIKDINGGLPYLESDTVSVYGIKKSVFCDRRFESAEALKARGLALLESLKVPYTTYTAKAADLSQLTGNDWDSFMPGKVVHVLDGEDGVEFEARIITVSKLDAGGRSADVDIIIANSVRDIADSINTLADRQSINDLYSQGATNLYAQQYADNADASHPAVMRVYVPRGCVRINQMLLSYGVEPFRAYETGAASGGGTTVTSGAGGGTTVTSESGGGSTVTSGAGGGTTATSSAGGGSTATSSAGGGSEKTSSAGGGGSVTSQSGGASVQAVVDSGTYISGSSEVGSTDLNSSQTTGSAGGDDTGYAYYAGAIKNDTGAGGGHSHSISGHTHTGASHAHGLAGHTHYVSSHTHSFSGSYSLSWGHTHSIPSPGTSDNTGGVNSYSAKTISISGTTGSGGGQYTDGNDGTTATAGTGTTGSTSLTTGAADSHTHNMQHYHAAPAHAHSVGAHTHDISARHFHTINHTHNVNIPSHTHTVSVGAHTHTVTIDHHTHSVQISDHTHDVEIEDHTHDVEIDDHTHEVEIEDHTHDVTVAPHTHGIVHGIYEGGTASQIIVRVDGTAVPEITSPSVNDLDIIEWLGRDVEGKITRGAWHTVELVPNALTRINASLFVQAFVQSVGGGDY